MPYWKDQKPPLVNQELGALTYDELIAKNWNICPRYLEVTVPMMATMTEVNDFPRS